MDRLNWVRYVISVVLLYVASVLISMAIWEYWGTALIGVHQFHPPIRMGAPNPAENFYWVSMNDSLIPLIGVLVMFVLAVPSFYKKISNSARSTLVPLGISRCHLMWAGAPSILMIMSRANRSHRYDWAHTFDAYDNYLG